MQLGKHCQRVIDSKSEGQEPSAQRTAQVTTGC